MYVDYTGTARCGQRISTFSLPSLDCLLRCSLGSDYRSLRSLSEWPSSLFFRTGARSRHPLLDSSLVFSLSPRLRQSRYPREGQISSSFFCPVLLFTHRASRIRPYPPSDQSSSLSRSPSRSCGQFEIGSSFDRCYDTRRLFVKCSRNHAKCGTYNIVTSLKTILFDIVD